MFLLIIVVIISCNNELEPAKKIKQIEYLYKLSFGYKVINLTTNGFKLIKTDEPNLKTGESIFVEFSRQKDIRYIQFIDSTNLLTVYKLYIDGKNYGEYNANRKIGIPKPVNSIRICIAKNGNERIVKGWDQIYIYSFIKDTSRLVTSPSSLVIVFKEGGIEYKKPVNLLKKARRINKLNKIASFVNKQCILVRKSKKNNLLVEYSSNFYPDGNFYLNYIEASKTEKKIENEFFISGNWKVINDKRNKKTIELDAVFSNMNNKTNKVDYYKTCIIIDSLNIIRSNDFLDGFVLDLPNHVMVNPGHFNNDFIIDIPYATTNNITGKKLYDCNKCYLLYQTVKDLLKAQKLFMAKGLKVRLLDCYRPYDVQKILYEAFPVSGYVADPVGGSIHNRGTAVDLTLVNKSGEELDMGTQYDDLTFKSNHGYTGFSDTIMQNRKLLRETMNSCNFVTIRLEWWHYNHQLARKYPKLNNKFPCNNI